MTQIEELEKECEELEDKSMKHFENCGVCKPDDYCPKEMLIHHRLEKVRRELKGLKEYIEIGRQEKTMSSEFYLRGFEKGKEKALVDVKKIIDETKNPYPENIFQPINKLEWMKIQTILQSKIGITLDRFSADLMRRARKIFQEELKLKLNQKEK